MRSFLFFFMLLSTFGFAQQTVVDVIVESDVHTTLEAAVIAAELDDDLSGEGPFTVFAPTDAAFEALPEGTVETLLQDPTGDLADILLYHVLGAEVLSTSLSDGQTATTLFGEDVTVTINTDGIFVNNAEVIMEDIQTDNGVVHVIDAVLLPSTITGVETIAAVDASLKIMPNPTTDYFELTLDRSKFELETVNVYNAQGQLMKAWPAANLGQTFEVADLAAGFYFVELLSTDQKRVVEKITVR